MVCFLQVGNKTDDNVMSLSTRTLIDTPFHAPSLKELIMNTFIANGGPFMYLILLFGCAALLLTLMRAARSLRGLPVERSQINTVLYLGFAAVLIGVAAQLTGLYQAATAILQATDISPAIIAQGILISFNSTLFGLYILLFSALLWLLLRAIVARRWFVRKEEGPSF
ncbi:hypothetical protein KQI65_01175 [bacterium]|nr:hypothetical protein [bacterium]